MGIGIEKGEHVAIWSDNKREWLLSQFVSGENGYSNSNGEFKETSYIDIIHAICPNNLR